MESDMSEFDKILFSSIGACMGLFFYMLIISLIWRI